MTLCTTYSTSVLHNPHTLRRLNKSTTDDNTAGLDKLEQKVLKWGILRHASPTKYKHSSIDDS